jgi:hypothetical protein
MTEPTESARAIRLEAMRRRDADNQVDRRDLIHYDTSQGALDRRWLLGEVERLTRERDSAKELLTAVSTDYERDVTP